MEERVNYDLVTTFSLSCWYREKDNVYKHLKAISIIIQILMGLE